MPLVLGIFNMFSHASLEALSWVVVILVFIVSGVAALGLFKKTVYENLNQSIGYSKDLADLANASSEAIKKKMTEMEADYKQQMQTLAEGQALNEKRIFRLEVDIERKTKQLTASRTEINMLENIVRVASSALNRLSTDQSNEDRKEIDALFKALTDERQSAHRDMELWEETKSTFDIYMRDRGAVTVDRRKERGS